MDNTRQTSLSPAPDSLAADAALLARDFRRDPTAFGALERAHGATINSAVRRVARRHAPTLDHNDLQDMVAEVWLTLVRDDYRKLRLFDASRGTPLRSWLRMIATRTTIDYLRVRHVHHISLEERAEPEPLLVSAPRPPDEVLEDKRRWQLLQAAMAALDTAEQRLLYSTDEPGSSARMARSLGITTGALHGRSFKARQKLQRFAAVLRASR